MRRLLITLALALLGCPVPPPKSVPDRPPETIAVICDSRCYVVSKMDLDWWGPDRWHLECSCFTEALPKAKMPPKAVSK